DALVHLCSRLMEKQPDKRFATAGEAAVALGDFLEGRYQTVSDDDLLMLAEDADGGGSGISRKTSQSSSLGRTLGGSSTAAGAVQSETVAENLSLAPDPAGSKSLLREAPKQPSLQPSAPQDAAPSSTPDFGL